MMMAFFYAPLLAIVEVFKALAWVIENGWWALLLLYLYSLFKHYKRA